MYVCIYIYIYAYEMYTQGMLSAKDAVMAALRNQK